VVRPADRECAAVTGAALALAVALLLWAPGTDLRVRRAGLRSPQGARRKAVEASAPRRRWLLAGGAAAAVGLLIGGAAGLVAAGVVAVGGERMLRRSAPDEGTEIRKALLRDLPGACDLIGVCLGAGVPVAGALTAVGDAVPGPLGAQLRTVAALYRLGAEPRRAWADVPVELAGLGRVLVRAGESGATVAPALRSLAADSRAAERLDAEAAVRRAGVWVLAPLGACFLPAFLCLGVVPLVLGIASDVFR
jgi:pilus assembly protein TadC